MGEVQGPRTSSILSGQDWLKDEPGKGVTGQPIPTIPPPRVMPDWTQVQQAPAFGMPPAQARFPAPQPQSLTERLGSSLSQLKDRIADPIREVREDYEQIGTLLSKPDLTAQDVRAAAAHAHRLAERISFLPQLKTLADDLDLLAGHVAMAEDRMAACDLPGLEIAVQQLKMHLQVMEQHLPMIQEKMDRAIQAVEQKQQMLAAGRDVLWQFDQTADGDILDFLQQTTDAQRTVLFGLSNETQFVRLFANASYSIVFEIYGSDDLARSVVEKAGAQLGRLQPFKLGVMAGHLCHGHTSEPEEKALIDIAMTLEPHELASFIRGLTATDVPFSQFLEEFVDYGDERQETLAALAAVYRATAWDAASRAEVQATINALPEGSRNFVYQYLGANR